MNDDSSRLPIALRRTPRQSTMRLHASTSPSQRRPRPHAVSKASGTPRQTRKTKASEITSIIVRDIEAGPITPPTTGRQHSKQRAIPTTKRRKNPKIHSPSTHDRAVRSYVHDQYGASPGCSEVRIFPLRAILDDRVKRRIRRNGLSEEMNTIYDERRQRAKKNDEAVQRLREQLAAKEIENDMLRDQSSLLQDTSRILELEKEISQLKHGLNSGGGHNASDDWNMVNADGFTDDDSLLDMDNRFRDDTTLEVESHDSLSHGKETQYIGTLTALTPPNTSPPRSASPSCSSHFFSASRCDVGVQAGSRDQSQAYLEDELTHLRYEVIRLQEALKASEQLESPKIPNVTLPQSTNTAVDVDPDLQLQTDIMLQTLAEKTAALADLNQLISSLGSPTSDAKKIVSTLIDAFESARQELEQIMPDEKPLPMSLEYTVILHTMLQSLRDSATQAKMYEKMLEDYCNREQHLREQLKDRVDAMHTMSSRLREKDDRIFRLEADMERSEAVVDEYRKCLANARHVSDQKDAELIDIQANLGSMVAVAADLQAQLAQVQVEGEIETTARKAKYEGDLTMRDLEISELRKEITALKQTLIEAHDSISQLQGENDRLKDDACRQKKAARDTVSSLRTQLLQSLQMSEAFLA